MYTFDKILRIVRFAAALTAVLLVTVPAGAQDVSEYLDDGEISTRRNVLSVNSCFLLTGDLPLHFEHAFTNHIALEVAAGVILPYYLFELTTISDGLGLSDQSLGYSIWIHPRYYFRPTAPEYNYIGPQYRRRQYNQGTFNDPLILHDFSMNYGFNLFVRKNFIIAYNLGLGFRFRSEDDGAGETKLEFNGIAMPWNLRFGFVF